METIISGLNSIIDYLNKNSGLITGIATVVLVIITWRYVRLTGELLKATYKPEIIIYPDVERRHDHLTLHNKYICVENVGTGVARKVKFGGDLGFNIKDGKRLNQIDFIQNGIDTLAPGQKRRAVLISFKDPMDEQYKPVMITVVCKDSRGGSHDGEFTLDFNDWTLPS